MPDEVVQYRPRVAIGVLSTGINVLTAAILLWVGSVLGPESVAAMDGFPRLLFTAIPIRPFTWVFALVFLFLGYLQARRTFTAEPILQISDAGLTFSGSTARPWSELDSIVVNKDDSLTLHFVDEQPYGAQSDKSPARKESRFRRKRGNKRSNKQTLSGFELGADTKAVKAQIEDRWRAQTSDLASGE